MIKTKHLIPLLLALFLALPFRAQALDQNEPTIYVIKKGDTLWGLSERFIKDPNYWPNMWSKNSQITNPHFIYPGQKVRIFPDRLEIVPTPNSKTAAAQQKTIKPDIVQEVAEEKLFPIRGNEGFLLENGTKPFGSIISGHHDRVLIGVDDMVYTDIGAINGVKGGEKFAIYKAESAVSHPLTSEIMGKKIVPLGTLQLTDVERTASRAIITRNYQEISPGSYLLPLRENPRREVALKMATIDLKGYIVESATGTGIIADGDIVYIDLGSNHGAEPGNMLYVVRDVKVDQRYAEGRVERLPQELLGALVILETGKKTATALVVKSIDAIYKGDKIVTAPK
ncbi:LysM peptidoglycan-binding domain-containing protein [Pelotalea chapellei]|uniref:LysM peptidoglycan-binding domain-containing protein n=1 Tax=Pelotalea chapellei TaxID=44671 RepID=UPI001FE5E700|nr:LysM peptidoglycan-binding domain-containing protein [Pelotalea chapellei]